MLELVVKPWEVLLVEESDDLARLVAAPLEQRGIPVCKASHAVQARERMTACRVALVLLDVKLPGGGIELASEIRRIDALLPIIYVTGESCDDLDDDVVSTVAPGFRRDLVKRVRERMDYYTTRSEARDTARVITAFGERIEKLEASRVIMGELVKSHDENLGKINSATGKAALIKQFLVAVFGIAGPIIGYFTYVSRDFARDQISELAQIKPLRVEFARGMRQLDALINDRQMERQEALQARLEQRRLATAVLDRLPDKKDER